MIHLLPKPVCLLMIALRPRTSIPDCGMSDSLAISFHKEELTERQSESLVRVRGPSSHDEAFENTTVDRVRDKMRN